MTSEPRYTDPTVAYNTGYNDGRREESEVWQKALADFEVALLHDEWATSLPRFCGRLKQLRDKLATPLAANVVADATRCGKPYPGGSCPLMRGHAGHCQD